MRRGLLIKLVVSIVGLALIQAIIVTGQSVQGNRFSPQQSLNNTAAINRYRSRITPDSLASRLYFLASDLFEGRETTTRGQKLAAQYLASQYQQLGLAPRRNTPVDNQRSPSAYFQPFTVYRRSPQETRLEITTAGTKVISTFSADKHDDLSFFLSGGLLDTTGPIVFAGYGIADEKLGYDDYQALKTSGISFEGKWLMLLEDEPLADASTSLLPTPDRKPSRWTTQFLNKRVAWWKTAQPKGVLVVSTTSRRTTDTFAQRAATASDNLKKLGGLSLFETSSAPPTFAISPKLANQMLAGSGQTIEGLKKKIDQTLSPVVVELGETVRVSSTAKTFPTLTTENVLAFIEGSDPKLKDEVVIVSSHYDHLGIDQSLKGDQIFNGAADDGSGVVASLEMAQQFMAAKRDGVGPRRSILFINFSGEEKGLLGSTYYATRQPVVPLEQTAAEINMDGVGGLDPKHPTNSKNYIYVIGTDDLSRDLIELTKQTNEASDMKLELTPGPKFGSDQASFENQLVPYVYYSTGYTDHYHQPTDEPKTIDYDHLARVVQLIFATTWQVANQDSRPKHVDRSQLKIVGYVCQPCQLECDNRVYDHPGECAACAMPLVPKFASK